MLAIALIADLLIFAAAWAFCVRIKNFSPVDAFWAFAIGLTSAYHLGSEPVSGKHAIAAMLIAVWSMRLGLHLAKRIIKHHPEEDSRYMKLREAWGEKTNPLLFLLFLGNAVLVFLLALPFHIIASDPDSTFDAFSIIGTIVTIIGLMGETIADKQKSAFKATNPDPKSVCRKGLWNYSRHPNYFFESVIWIGIFLFAAGSPYGWATIYAPAIITFLLLKVTGIPPTEASALKRKGEAYREYQRTTSAFIPLPPRISSTDH